MRVLGHRGSRVPGPENTIAAVQAALAAGAAGVEVDARRCADGQLVVHHDPLLRGRPILAWPPGELALRGVPLLSEVLAACRGRGQVVCEVKNAPADPDHDPTSRRTLAALLPLLSAPDDLVVSSFDPTVAAAARSEGLVTGLLTRPGVTVGSGAAAAAEGGHQLHAHVSSVRLDRSAARRCHDQGVELVVWTVTRLALARRLQAGGVDAIIADDPAGLVPGLSP